MTDEGASIPLEQAIAACDPELADTVRELYGATSREELVERMAQVPGSVPASDVLGADRWWGSHQLLLRLRLYAEEDAALLRALEPSGVSILPRLVGCRLWGSYALLITRFPGPWPTDRPPVPADQEELPPSLEALDAFWQDLLGLARYDMGYPDLPFQVHRVPESDRLVLPYWGRLFAIGDAEALEAYLAGAGERLTAWLRDSSDG